MVFVKNGLTVGVPANHVLPVVTEFKIRGKRV